MMKKMRKNSGFSMVEVVIALAVIVIVTITALSFSLSSIVTKAKSVSLSRAQVFAENVWECFKAADGYDDFVDLVKFAEEIELGDPEAFEGDTIIHEYGTNNFFAEIKVNYSNSRPTLSITMTEDDGDEIVAFEYVKGGLTA